MTTNQSSLDRFRRLDRAYLRLLASSLPSFSSKRRAQIPGQLVVLDSLTGIPKLRSIPPGLAEDDTKYKKINQAIKKTVSIIKQNKGNKFKVDAENVKEAIRILWHEIGEDKKDDLASLAREKDHPIKGSFFDKVIIKRMLDSTSPEPFYEAGAYIPIVEFENNSVEEAFEALLGEVALCTHELKSIEDVKPELIIPIFVPFSSLGILRGVAVWFLLDEEERSETKEQMLRALSLGLINTLNAMCSNAVIDVFTAYWMSRLGDLTFSGGSQLKEITEEAFKYLYPCHNFIPDSSCQVENKNCINVEFNDATVQKFLGFSKSRWDLVYPKDLGFFFNWDGSKGKGGCNTGGQTESIAYIHLIEAKLRDVALTATDFLNQEHWRILEVFGHHTGNLFKTSGAINLISSYNRGDEISVAELKRSLDTLMPIWGIAGAISFIQKKDSDKYGFALKNWLNEQLMFKSGEEIAEGIYSAIIKLVRHIYESSSAQPPFFKWVIEAPEGIDSSILVGEWALNDGRRGGLESIPLFKDVQGLFEKTSAVTIGLFEMIKNVRAYPDLSIAKGKDEAEALNSLSEREKVVRIKCTSDPGRGFQIQCIQPIFLWKEKEMPNSESLRKICDIEAKGFKGWVHTTEMSRYDTTCQKKIVLVSQSWHLDWRKIKEEAERIYGKKS